MNNKYLILAGFVVVGVLAGLAVAGYMAPVTHPTT